jgi:plasmid stabilization system protein ParE
MPRKNRRIDWSASAARELLDALVRLAAESAVQAVRVRSCIDRAGRFLELNPLLGKRGAVAGTLEYPVPRTPFTLIYEAENGSVHILRCWRQSRQGADDAA